MPSIAELTPAKSAVAVTASDVTEFDASRALYVGGAGDLYVDMKDTGVNVLFAGVPAGTMLDISVTRVYATGLTASNIVRVY